MAMVLDFDQEQLTSLDRAGLIERLLLLQGHVLDLQQQVLEQQALIQQLRDL